MSNDADEIPVQMAEVLLSKLADRGIDLGSNPYAINVGCGDGHEFNDPVYRLYKSGYKGVAIDAQNLPALTTNLAPFGVELRPDTAVTPANIISVLAGAACPERPAFLKMDIDGVDAEVIRAILHHGVRPFVIQAEINPEIPPPYGFSVCSSARYNWGGSCGFFGFSLSYGMDLLSEYGYRLVGLDFETQFAHDGLWAHDSILDKAGIVGLDPAQTFLSKPPLLPHLHTTSYGEKYSWRTRPDHEVVRAEIWKAVLEANRLKHGHTEVPFELYISRSAHAPRS